MRCRRLREVPLEGMDRWREWARLSEGCYVLRSNVTDWNSEELWRAYMQLTEAEAAFRIHKTDLQLRPIWHQRQERVEAHILVCFLAYVLWKTLAQTLPARRVGQRTSESIPGVGGDHPGRRGVANAKRSNHPKALTSAVHRAAGVLLQHLNLRFPNSLEMAQV